MTKMNGQEIAKMIWEGMGAWNGMEIPAPGSSEADKLTAEVATKMLLDELQYQIQNGETEDSAEFAILIADKLRKLA